MWGWMLQTNGDLAILASMTKYTHFLLNRPYLRYASKSMN